MSHSVLDRRDEENLVRAIEFALPIRRRNQFFLWTQGLLQALIPHEVLFCAHGAPSRKTCSTDQYTAQPFSEAAYREICSPARGLLVISHAEWERRGSRPMQIGPGNNQSLLVRDCGELLERYGFDNCAAHGLPAFRGDSGSFFFFARMPTPLQRRHAYLLDIILPYLHVAYLRTLTDGSRSTVRSAAGAPIRTDRGSSEAMTARQIQILQWLHEGKSNREIAEILSISPFTVKNHVQNILRKLNVKNRTEAVSFALSIRLITAQPHGVAR